MGLKSILGKAGLGALAACAQADRDGGETPEVTVDSVAQYAGRQEIRVFTDDDVIKAADRVQTRVRGGYDKTAAIDEAVWNISNEAARISRSSREFDTSLTGKMDDEYAEYWSGKFREQLLAVLDGSPTIEQ